MTVFEEYNGWVNSPTWDVFSILTSYDQTREQLETMVQQGGSVAKATQKLRTWTTAYIDRFIKGKMVGSHQEAMRSLMQHWVTDPARHISWNDIYQALQGQPQQQNELMATIINVLQQIDWRSIVGEGRSADQRLRDWCQDQCLIWIDNPEARKHPGSLAVLPQALIEYYSKAVQWGDVARALQGIE